MAQALLEKATAIDPDYGQALGVLATGQTFSAHMGWADMAAVVPIGRARGAGRDPGRQRRSLGASRTGFALICSLDASRIRWPSWRSALRLNPNFSLAQGYYGLALVLCRALGRGNAWPRAARCG